MLDVKQTKAEIEGRKVKVLKLERAYKSRSRIGNKVSRKQSARALAQLGKMKRDIAADEKIVDTAIKKGLAENWTAWWTSTPEARERDKKQSILFGKPQPTEQA